MLPPFVSVRDHKLDIVNGVCKISFGVEVASSNSKAAVKNDEEQSPEKKTDTDAGKEEQDKVAVVVSVDVSLPLNRDGSIDSSKPAYPFGAPIAQLISGMNFFPDGSTIEDGDQIGVDLDWTPSLHITDAILNIALKIKESIMQKEPFHPTNITIDPVDEITQTAKRFANNLSIQATKASSQFSNVISPLTKTIQQQKRKPNRRFKKKGKPPAKSSEEIRIGDEINLLAEPWVDAHGVYSCKAIRRPVFIEEALQEASQEEQQQAFQSPTSMFKSFTQSARSVLEESFLMITDTHIIELKSSKLNMSMGTVTIAIPIDLMAKLKFRRQESVSLFFKISPDDPLVYMCPDSGDAVHQIQAVLKQHGVKGKHTNAAAHRAINEALHLVQEIQTKELALKHDPTVDRVNGIMNLYRQAAERFEVAGDVRHEEVVMHMRKFLALPLTTSILEGTYKKPDNPIVPSPKSADGCPEGEIIERTEAQIDDNDMDGSANKTSEEHDDKLFEENMDNLLKEAEKDLDDFMVDDKDPEDDFEPSFKKTTDSDDDDGEELANVAADLDAMMKEADKEFAELMNS